MAGVGGREAIYQMLLLFCTYGTRTDILTLTLENYPRCQKKHSVEVFFDQSCAPPDSMPDKVEGVLKQTPFSQLNQVEKTCSQHFSAW